MPLNFSRAPLLAALLGIASCAQAPAQPSQIETFDTIVDDVVQRYHLPGIALGVIQDGKVIYKRTAGELSAGSGQQVNADTLFKIASNSKAMTTGVLARLVDAGKLKWDDPVTKYLPQFRMYDAWVTQNMQVRDLLIHNSGLREGAGDLMLWPEPNQFTRADIIAGLAHLMPQHSFRSRYAYDNLMYVVAGEVAAAAGGASYEDLVRRELFEPLGMSRCQAGAFNREAVGNVAQPHMRQYNGNVVIRADEANVPVSTSAAAGGIRCSLNDMLTWMQLWLDADLESQQGDVWLSKEQRTAVWSAHTPMPLSRRQREWDGSRFNAYGYGWRVSDVDGVLRVAHTGTLAGMFSAVNLFPERNAGFVFLINGDGSDARAVLNTVLAKYLTDPDRARAVTWYAQSLESERAREPAENRAHDTSSRQAVTPGNMTQWLGVYRDPWFGDVSICARESTVGFVAAKSPRMAGRIMQVGERRLVDWDDDSIDAEPWLEFSSAQPATLQLSKVDPDADFSYDYDDLAFTRIRDCP
ncbi:serine hydrolase domain-containing protein [Povalibacter sp.]|uniref:serine hydrolase domain-containing protein n=1 Tax=Povalibacter sp. TaxID=1962978 RepID=UPI002F3FA6FC